MLPKKLQEKLTLREANNSFRQLPTEIHLVDFTSNDYLGLARNRSIAVEVEKLLEKGRYFNGATGSRLLSGNHALYERLETVLCEFHKAEAALVFNSGYDANIGFLSSVPQRGDIVLYDEYVHASIRDGIRMGNARAYKFAHNDLENLGELLKCHREVNREVYVVTESVFSMDGDSPDLSAMVSICQDYEGHLIVDEAHAVGVFDGGLLQMQGLQSQVFARLATFGKALGCHGAAVLGSKILKRYLVNFARSLIYTTALPPHTLATVLVAYKLLKGQLEEPNFLEKQQLNLAIDTFKQHIFEFGLQDRWIVSNSAIQSVVITENDAVKRVASLLQQQGFDVRPILSPTVPKGQERLRFCLHSYNTLEEIARVMKLLATFVS